MPWGYWGEGSPIPNNSSIVSTAHFAFSVIFIFSFFCLQMFSFVPQAKKMNLLGRIYCKLISGVGFVTKNLFQQQHRYIRKSVFAMSQTRTVYSRGSQTMVNGVPLACNPEFSGFAEKLPNSLEYWNLSLFLIKHVLLRTQSTLSNRMYQTG